MADVENLLRASAFSSSVYGATSSIESGSSAAVSSSQASESTSYSYSDTSISSSAAVTSSVLSTSSENSAAVSSSSVASASASVSSLYSLSSDSSFAVMSSTLSNSGGSTSTTSPTGPTIVPDVTAPGGINYQQEGCYEDPSGDGYPLVAPYVDGTITTVDQCISDCSTINNFVYAAVEGSTCYCSNSIYFAPQTLGACDTPCSGDPTQACAGMKKRIGGHIVVYKLAPLPSSSSTLAATTSSIGSPSSSCALPDVTVTYTPSQSGSTSTVTVSAT
ncbi:hypothetical protein BDZ45DRAFT_672444 [Acephala macrosclerotiorum]|nr:hypothetical protein BDZ45DRAFT_672444 [Acephala macrosclerotiorum]